jgi:arabinogalactan endo-1,4-beta-galactosidase
VVRKFVLVALLTLELASVPQLAASAATTVTNPGFESGAGQSPSGWSEAWANFDDVTFTSAAATGPLQIKGADVSSLKKNEDHGAVYRNSSGTQQDALAILRASGVNYARLEVWVSPADGYNNKTRVLAMATRVKAQGMKQLVDFHYSDSWADPGQQNKPAAWRSYGFSQLRDAVRAVPNNRGLGVFYWEPTRTAVPGAGWDPTDLRSGDGWENQALFDYSDRALPALTVS